MFVAILTCISLSVTGCTDLAGGHHPGEPSAESALGIWLLEGHELHASLQTESFESIPNLPAGMVLPKNPHLSTDAKFVEATARGGSQGRLNGDGMRSALYARYAADKSEIGFYGLEANSEADADQREKALREIWAYNASLDRARVYRRGLALFVVWIWTDGVLPECWEAVKTKVEERLIAPGML